MLWDNRTLMLADERPADEGAHEELLHMSFHTHVEYQRGDSKQRKIQKSSSVGDKATKQKIRRVHTAAFTSIEDGSEWFENSGSWSTIHKKDGQLQRQHTLDSFGTQETIRDAADNFMSHLYIDPDGGVSNLLDDNQTYVGDGGSQVTKFPIIEKDMSKRVIALVYILRLALNIPTVVFGGTRIVYCYWSPHCPSFTQRGHDEDLKKINLPLETIALLVAAWEVVAGIALILQVCYHGIQFAATNRAPPGTKFKEALKVDFEKYRHLVMFFWEGMQRLQNFSALRALGAVHPSLLSHYAKDCNIGNTAALELLEHYLHLPKHRHLIEEEVLELGVAQLVRLKHGPTLVGSPRDTPESDQMQHKTHEYILMDCYTLLCELKRAEAGIISHPEGLRYSSPRKDSLRALWRVSLIGWIELVVFWLKAIFLACFGWAAFMIKLVEVAVVIFDPSSSIKLIAFETLAFMNQIMGIIGVNQLLRWRLFRFIFGGQDAYVSAEERLVMSFYEARLVQAIWTSHSISNYERWLILLTFDDDDLQGLVMEEGESDKVSRHGLLWRALTKRAHICGCLQAEHEQAHQGVFHVWGTKFVKAFL
eukprot:gnl/MRDRNA2_/MRDRNA2_120438_c0_seq1.p1 gnl/MRDRNA2_/MRDRNA2_120438_c0~~gnl/MRDRNA2_/MRDRNA2_120438_c0_seq1.p1  ORF type:complete len:592 (+),score=84.83 gnl/MRDRNA2_/MRDRNA2_120438_c0_seq1:214-1989(+)